jgi:ribonuclease Z
MHSTSEDAATVAREANVKKLVLIHISPRYSKDNSELLSQARKIFPNTVIAEDGMEISV